MNSLDDYLSIDTPENVIFGYEVAGIGSRFLAALIDTIVIIILQIIVNLTLFLLLVNVLDNSFIGRRNMGAWLSALFGLISFVFFWGYYILFEMIWNGQSPGKRWIGLRVIRIDGTPITLIESIIRNLVRLIDFLPMAYGVGVVTMFINEQARRLGDLAAGTLVVHDRATITLESLAVESSRPRFSSTTSTPAGDWPIERLAPHDLRLAEDFLRRRFELSNRFTLARRLVQALFERMSLPAPPADGREAEKLLLAIVEASRQRHADQPARPEG